MNNETSKITLEVPTNIKEEYEELCREYGYDFDNLIKVQLLKTILQIKGE